VKTSPNTSVARPLSTHRKSGQRAKQRKKILLEKQRGI
jgi:hypothetical protein